MDCTSAADAMLSVVGMPDSNGAPIAPRAFAALGALGLHVISVGQAAYSASRPSSPRTTWRVPSPLSTASWVSKVRPPHPPLSTVTLTQMAERHSSTVALPPVSARNP